MSHTALAADYSVSMTQQMQAPVARESYSYETEKMRLQTLQEDKSSDATLQEATPEQDTVRNLQLIKKQDKFTALQKWAGYVLEIRDETFTARLTDLKNREVEEEAEIYLAEVSEEDRPLLQPGAVFYWSIGYRDDYSGQRHNEGFIRFRRLPVFSRKDIERARQEAEEIRQAFGWSPA